VSKTLKVCARMSGVGWYDHHSDSPSSISRIGLELFVRKNFTQADLGKHGQRVVLEGTV
jgi:hypothetical protein